jgi:hypothetical protein
LIEGDIISNKANVIDPIAEIIVVSLKDILFSGMYFSDTNKTKAIIRYLNVL